MTDILTASKTSRPARSMAAARLNGKRDVGFVRRDHGVDQPHDVAARKIVGLKIVERNIQPRFHRADARRDYGARRYSAQAHADEGEEAHVGARRPSGDPERNRHQIQNENQAPRQLLSVSRTLLLYPVSNSNHLSPLSVDVRCRRATMRLPSTRVTIIAAPGSINSPSDTTSSSLTVNIGNPGGSKGRDGSTLLSPAN